MDIKDEIAEVISKTLEVAKEELKEDESLADSIGVDSTEMVELCIALSKHFDIKIATTEITKQSTPLGIVEVVKGKKQ